MAVPELSAHGMNDHTGPQQALKRVPATAGWFFQLIGFRPKPLDCCIQIAAYFGADGAEYGPLNTGYQPRPLHHLQLDGTVLAPLPGGLMNLRFTP